MERKFNPEKQKKLNNPQRLIELPPEFIVEKLNIADPHYIVDIGAGTAFYSRQFARLFPEAQVVSCDISDVMLNWIEENVVPEYNNISTHYMQESNTGLDSGVADFVLMINLHHELESRSDMMKECCRLLKPGGKLAISDWKKEETVGGPPLQIRLSTDEVAKDLEIAGFKNIQVYNELQNNFLVIGTKS
ncbi:MAG: class I SAM-dependent methyltransferase [Saprospiraceae bacterium]